MLKEEQVIRHTDSLEFIQILSDNWGCSKSGLFTMHQELLVGKCTPLWEHDIVCCDSLRISKGALLIRDSFRFYLGIDEYLLFPLHFPRSFEKSLHLKGIHSVVQRHSLLQVRWHTFLLICEFLFVYFIFERLHLKKA